MSVSIPSGYQLTPKDLQSSGLELARIHASGQSAATDLNSAIFTLPADHLLVIEQVSVILIPGAGQAALRFALSETLNTSGTLFAGYVYVGAFPTVAGQRYYQTARLQYIAGPASTLMMGSSYDAGAVANFHEVTIHGWLIPRANVQLAGNR